MLEYFMFILPVFQIDDSVNSTRYLVDAAAGGLLSSGHRDFPSRPVQRIGGLESELF
jgi:hypothetical protein